MTPAAAGPDHAIASVSAVAAAWIARAAPVRFGIAIAAEDVAATYRLRHEIVVGRGWAPAHVFPGGLERDVDDETAVLIAAWHDDRVVATARLIRPDSERPLPTEAAFDMTLAGRDRLIDIGRVCVASGYRDAAHRIFRGVLGQVWCEMHRLGYHEAATVISDAGARLYERWGLGVTILGPSRMYWGERRSPARVAPAAALDRLLRRLAPPARA